jgi:GNAT superfamily N-acetyltransferase
VSDSGGASFDLVATLEAAECSDMADWFDLGPASRMEGCGGAAQTTAGATVCLRDRQTEVYGFGSGRRVEETHVDEIMEMAARARATKQIWKVAPGAQAGEIEAWLAARGFRLARTTARLVRSPGECSGAPIPFTIVRATDAAADEFVRVAAKSYRLDPQAASWLRASIGRRGREHFLALAGEKPIGTGAMVVFDGVAAFGYDATLPSYRRRGSQSALIAHRLDRAAHLGCHLATAEAWLFKSGKLDQSARNYIRCGFELAYTVRVFVRSG